MLSVTRKADQTIHIGSEITVHIVEVRGTQVGIETTAPKNLLVLRDELRRSHAARIGHGYQGIGAAVLQSHSRHEQAET